MEEPAPAPAPADDELTITLRKPATLATESWPKLVLREPTAAQMIQWDRLSGAEANIMAVSVVSGVPRTAIEQIGVRDLLAAARFIGSFALIPAPPETDSVPDELVVPLRKAVTIGETRVDQLQLREPRAIDLIEWDKADGVEADCQIIAAVSGAPLNAVKQIGARDLVTAAAYLANFLEPGQSAGGLS